MKKLLKSKKALSPVVAAIILIAVTVAVSIAVAAWMGSLTFTFMETEEMIITKVEFPTSSTIDVTVMNTGTTDIVISAVEVTGLNVTGSSLDATVTVGKGTTDNVDITVTYTGTGIAAGSSYYVELVSSKGNKFSYTANAPN
jgi:flagellin-like protein